MTITSKGRNPQCQINLSTIREDNGAICSSRDKNQPLLAFVRVKKLACHI